MNHFYNLKIATKLLAAFALVLILSIVLGVFSIIQLAKVNQTSTEQNENWLPSVESVLILKNDVMEFRVMELQHILSTDDEGRAQYEKKLSEILAKFQKNNLAYQKLISEPQEKAVYTEFTNLWNRYLQVSQGILALSREGKRDEAMADMRGYSLRLRREMAVQIDKLAEINMEGAAKADQAGDDLYARARGWIIVILLATVGLGMMLAMWIAGAVSRPLNQAVRIAQTVAAGDLSSEIEVSTTDETGQLLQALKDMNGNLQNIVSQVRSGTDTIATASSEIASGNLDLSTMDLAFYAGFPKQQSLVEARCQHFPALQNIAG